jgi:hypothetical protein
LFLEANSFKLEHTAESQPGGRDRDTLDGIA